MLLTFLSCKQCDQIWRYFNTGTILKVLGKFLMVYLVFGKILFPLWKTCFTFGQVFIVVNGQMCNIIVNHLVTLHANNLEGTFNRLCFTERRFKHKVWATGFNVINKFYHGKTMLH